MKMNINLIVCLFLIGSCSSFTTEKIMKIHQGMSSANILELFGEPNNISQSVCGSGTGKPWTCTTWEYGSYYEDRASFTFSGESRDSLILNNYTIKRR